MPAKKKKIAPSAAKKGRPAKSGDISTLHCRIPTELMNLLHAAAERKRWSRTVAIEELIRRFADKL